MKDRTPKSFLGNVATVPAAFIAAFAAAFALAFLMMTAVDAVAQPAEQPSPTENGPENGAMPDHGFAPPSDEVPPTDDKTPPITGGSAADPVDPNSQHDMNTGVGEADMHSKDANGVEHAEHEADPTKNFNWFKFGYHGKDEKGGDFGDGKEAGVQVEEEEPMPAPYIAALFNFAILAFLMIKWFRPAARTMAAERHDQIKTALEEAALLRKQAADKLAEYEKRLKSSDDEIKSMVDAIRASAEADKIRILENAERASVQMKKDAESRIAAEIQHARATLTKEVTEAAAAATEKLLREKLMPADQQKLVATFITDIAPHSPTQEKR